MILNIADVGLSISINCIINIILLSGFMKYSKKFKEANKQREKMYVNNWNVSQGLKFYDALEDSFATYYFANPTVKKHLKHLQKAVKKQPKTSQVLRVTFLLQSRFRNDASLRQGPKRTNASNSLDDSVIKPYEKDLKPQSLEKLKKINKIDSNGQHPEKMGRAQSYDDRLPKLNKVYHSRNESGQIKPTKKKYIVEYLEKKKKQMQKNKQ